MTNRKILVIGSCNTDMSVQADKLPCPGETVLGSTFHMGAGGKGANQAVAARLLGGDVTFVCKVGRDLFGEKSLDGYKACGIDISHVMFSDKPSGVALITVDSHAENSIVVASGANNDITPDDMDTIAGTIRSASLLLMQLEIPLSAVERAAAIAHEAGVPVVLNPAPAAKLPESLFSCVDLIIPNETEAAAITGMRVADEDSAVRAATSLKSKGIDNVIITLGSKGSLVCNSKISHVPAMRVNAVDTTAAGDTFCGAVCVALSEGRSLEEAVHFATAAAALSVQRFGAQDSVPTRGEVDEITIKA